MDGLGWALQWPSRILMQLQEKHPAGLRRVLRHMSNGVQLATRFSGIECAGHALREIGKAIQKEKLVDFQQGVGFSLVSVLDNNSKCQLCLAELGKAWEKDGCAPRHCFSSMEACVEYAALQEMHAALEAHRKKGDSGDLDPWPLLRTLIGILLLGGLKDNQFCVLHGRECPYYTPDEQGNAFSVHCAGTPCVDFSRRGKRKRGLGDTIIPLAFGWRSSSSPTRQPGSMSALQIFLTG